MYRKFRTAAIILVILMTVFSTALTEGLKLSEDAASVEIYPYSTDLPDGPVYTYSYCYPRIDENEACAGEINGFYDYLISDALNFSNPMMADDLFHMGIGSSSFTDISYTLRCNNGSYFSILLRKHSLVDGYEDLIYEGHTFAVEGGRAGSTVALPYLLGLLRNDVNDTWLEDRQTQKVEEFTRELVWDAISEDVADGKIVLLDGTDYDCFSENFYPEEDFYLNTDGEPVFFIQPGRITDLSVGLLEYPIALDTLYDEF